MDRCLGSQKGFTLLEMILAIVIGAIVLITSADLLINFAKFSSNIVKSESLLMDASLGAFEEIVYNTSRANLAALGSETAIATPSTPFPGGCSGTSCIQVRVDTDAATKTPQNYADDTVYSYWLSAGVLYRQIGTGSSMVIARGVTTLTFSRPGTDQNAINLVFESKASGGATTGEIREYFQTTVILRAKSV
jgi:prepilin-type N-terminal cleavage/methylation domain-containing protein